MVYDFGLMKKNIKDLIDSFDHAITIWDKDNVDYIQEMKNHSSRWVELPVSPSAEQFSRVFFLMIDRLLQLTKTVNNEKEVQLYSVIVHETKTGYAQCFKDDAYSLLMGKISLEDVKFSSTVVSEWQDKLLWKKLLDNQEFVNPTEV